MCVCVCVCVCVWVGGGGGGGRGASYIRGGQPGQSGSQGRPGVSAHYRLQVGCHLAGVNKCSCGTEEAPALLVPQRQPSDAQGSPKLIKLW